MSEEIPGFVNVDSEMVGLVMGFHARRIMARNALVEYATNMKSPPSLEATATMDLMALYQDLLDLEDAVKTSEDLFELIAYKRIQAEGLVERVRQGDLSDAEINEHMRLATNLVNEVEELTIIMEKLAGAS